ERRNGAPVERGEHFIDADDGWPRHDALDRDAAVSLAQMREDGILDGIAGREADMTALRLLHATGVAVAPQIGGAKAGAGADDADRAARRKRNIRPGERFEPGFPRLADGMA